MQCDNSRERHGGTSLPYMPYIRPVVEAALTKRPQAMARLGDVAKDITPYLGLTSPQRR